MLNTAPKIIGLSASILAVALFYSPAFAQTPTPTPILQGKFNPTMSDDVLAGATGVYQDIQSDVYISGNVGIGNTNPSYKLELSGDGRVNQKLYFGTKGAVLDGPNQGGSLELGPTGASALSETPFVDFHFGTTPAQDYNFRIINSADDTLNFQNSSGSPLSISGNTTTMTGATKVQGILDVFGQASTNNGFYAFPPGWGADYASLSYDGTTAKIHTPTGKPVYVDGSIGIRTITPGDVLEAVDGTARMIFGNVVSTYGGIYLGGTSGAISTSNYQFAANGTSNTLINTGTGGSIGFRVNNTDKMVIDQNGNVGIGTVSPGQKLSVAGTLGILEGGASPQYYTTFQGGDQTGNITYTLPASMGTNGQVLSLNDGTGTLAWANGGVGSGDVIPSDSPSGSYTQLDGTTTNAGQGTSMVIGSDGFTRVAYFDLSGNNIKYIRCTNNSCTGSSPAIVTSVTLDSATPKTTYISMKLASDGTPRIAYNVYDGTLFRNKLMYIQCLDVDCTNKSAPATLDSSVPIAYPSLALTSTNLPYVAYKDNTANTGRLKLAQCSTTDCSSGISTSIVENTNNSGYWPAIAVASDNQPRVAYATYVGSTNVNLLNYIVCLRTDCVYPANANRITLLSNLTGASGVQTYTSLILSTQPGTLNYGRIVFANNSAVSGMGLRYIGCTADGCPATSPMPFLDSDTVTYTSIAQASDGTPRVAYFDTVASDLKFVKCTDSSCTTTTNTVAYIDTTGNVGQYNSIGVNTTNNKSYISYFDSTNGDLRLAYDVLGGGKNIGSPTSYWKYVYAENYFGKTTTISSFDVAEDYPVSDPSIEAGDLVMIDPRATADSPLVTKSQQAYEAKLAGAISTKPGVRLSDWQKDSPLPLRPVALTGQTPVKVSLENGPIQAGDLLTSSSTPGVAMKATKAGIIIGKALQPYSGPNINKINVFINTSWYDPDATATQTQLKQMEKEIKLLKQEINSLKQSQPNSPIYYDSIK